MHMEYQVLRVWYTSDSMKVFSSKFPSLTHRFGLPPSNLHLPFAQDALVGVGFEGWLSIRAKQQPAALF